MERTVRTVEYDSEGRIVKETVETFDSHELAREAATETHPHMCTIYDLDSRRRTLRAAFRLPPT